MNIVENYLTHCGNLNYNQNIFTLFNALCVFPFVIFGILTLIFGYIEFKKKERKGACVWAISGCLLLGMAINIICGVQRMKASAIKDNKIAIQKYEKATDKLVQKYPNAVILQTREKHFGTNAQVTILFTKTPLSEQELNDYAHGKSIDVQNSNQVVCQFNPTDVTNEGEIKFPNQYFLNDYHKLKNIKTNLWTKKMIKTYYESDK